MTNASSVRMLRIWRPLPRPRRLSSRRSTRSFALRSKDDLVIQVADRCGLEKGEAQRALLKGRRI
jgi:hypothetical protein